MYIVFRDENVCVLRKRFLNGSLFFIRQKYVCLCHFLQFEFHVHIVELLKHKNQFLEWELFTNILITLFKVYVSRFTAVVKILYVAVWMFILNKNKRRFSMLMFLDQNYK